MKRYLLFLIALISLISCQSKSEKRSSSVDGKEPTGYYKVKNDTTLEFISLKDEKFNYDIVVKVQEDKDFIPLQNVCLGEFKYLKKLNENSNYRLEYKSDGFMEEYKTIYVRDSLNSYSNIISDYNRYIEFDGLRDSLNPETILITYYEKDTTGIQLISGGKIYEKHIVTDYDHRQGVLTFTSVKGVKVKWMGTAKFTTLYKGKPVPTKITVTQKAIDSAKIKTTDLWRLSEEQAKKLVQTGGKSY